MLNLQGRVNSEIILLCERLEIAEFMNAYLRYLFRDGVALPAVQIINCHKFSAMKTLIEKIALIDKKQKVRKVIFIADAVPNEVQKRKNFLSAVCSSTYLQKMEYCTHFFFPGKKTAQRWKQGYLEDALLLSLLPSTSESIDYYNLYYMSEDYLLSVKNSRREKLPLENYSRHLLYTYFAGTEKYVGLHLGEAAMQGAFNLNHQVFTDLKAIFITCQ